MKSVTVGEIMTTDFDVVSQEMPLSELAQAFQTTHHHGFIVVDSIGDLAGVVSLQDLESEMDLGSLEGKYVRNIATTSEVLVSYPGESMGDALQRMAIRDVGRLPVLENRGSKKVIGVLRRLDVIRAYNLALANRAHHQHRIETLKLNQLNEASFYHVDIPQYATVVGKTIREIELPKDCLIVSVRRGRKLLVAHGYTQLRQGDQLAVFARVECLADVQHALLNVAEPHGE